MSAADDMHELMFVYELKERLTVCIYGYSASESKKRDTMAQFCMRILDYPEKSDDWLKYVNSKMKDGGKSQIIYQTT